PTNRRKIWSIIKKLKEDERCVILTTHHLEEADILSDKIAIMTDGRLQAYGSSEFLKQQTSLKYRLFIEKASICDENRVTCYIQQYVNNVILEQESMSELIYGIPRGKENNTFKLIEQLDRKENRENIQIDGFGISMITIEDVFIQLVKEAQTNHGYFEEKKKQLAHAVFDVHDRITTYHLYIQQFYALIVKRLLISCRQYIFLIGFFLLSILIEIIIVCAFPTPVQILSTLLQNDHVKFAQVQLIPSIYNSKQTIVVYGNNFSELQNVGTIEQLTTDTIMSYIQQGYHETEMIFIQKYQIAQARYTNVTFNAYFSTVNYHAAAVSLGVSMNQLFQYYSNSSQTKQIITINQPIITTESTSTSSSADLLAKLFCFDIIPMSLFGFMNSIVATLYTSMIILLITTERVSKSKYLQLMANLSKWIYWLSNATYDFVLCFILCSLLTIIVKISAVATTNFDAEVISFNPMPQTILFFIITILFSCASLPFVYIWSFFINNEIIGFINYVIINIVACFFDVVLNFVEVYTIGQSVTSSVMTALRWILAVLFPTVNFKRSLYNIRIHDNNVCIDTINSILSSNLKKNEMWSSIKEPGIGLHILIFFIQMIVWWLLILLIENKQHIKCICKQKRSALTDRFDDKNLPDDVYEERNKTLATSENSQNVLIVKDLIQQFKKGKTLQTAVDHLNFAVTHPSCFGLLGINGAGKTTTFRMLIGELLPTSGDIFIRGKNIVTTKSYVQIGYCPQFDWLIYYLTVNETLTLFAHLHGLKEKNIPDICTNTIQLFGLDSYITRRIQKLSGGNGRKVSTALAFMANPEIVFLDEPTTGLDVVSKRKVWEVIRAARNAGMTIILTSH
ncbi:unnamed protein product, partial [Didymodactylos carnosus]